MADFPQPSDDVFLDLEDVKIDPYFEQVYHQSVQLDADLNSLNPTIATELEQLEMDDKRVTTLEKMNGECPYLHKIVAVTGTVLQPYWDELESTYKYEEKVYKREPLISSGYASIKMGPKDEERWVTGHLFYVGDTPARSGDAKLVEETGTLYGFVPVGKADIEYEKPDEETDEQLRFVLPELMAHLDTLFSEGADETDVLKSLRDITLERGEDVPTEAYEALMAYVWKRLNFDQEIPYTCVTKGSYLDSTDSDDDEGSFQHDGDVERIMLIRPCGLSLIPFYKKKGEELVESEDLHWYLQCFVAASQYGVPHSKFQIPVRNIQVLSSIRRLAYGTEQ